jgi:hypothetical protein
MREDIGIDVAEVCPGIDIVENILTESGAINERVRIVKRKNAGNNPCFWFAVALIFQTSIIRILYAL